ncbi:MAG: SGNH/GDSL hydrolase family protein [Aequorivita antarctica]
MNRMPPPSVWILIWALLLGYLTLNFINKASKDFIQFNYDWDSMAILDTIEKIKIDSISNDFLSIQNNFRNPEFLNGNNTFFLNLDKKSYFRSSEILKDSNQIVFSGVKWINSIPNVKDVNTAKLAIVNLPLVQSKGIKTMTLGDSQIIWRSARELRRNLAQKGKFYFVGTKSDVYGYPFEGGTFDKATELISKLKKSEPAAYYILFFGAQDKNTDKTQLKDSICEILRFLQHRDSAEKIFLITLPPSTNAEFDSYNKNFNKTLSECAELYKKSRIIDLYNFLGDKTDYLAKDKVHLNDKGYLFLNKLLLKEIP